MSSGACITHSVGLWLLAHGGQAVERLLPRLVQAAVAAIPFPRRIQVREGEIEVAVPVEQNTHKGSKQHSML